VYRYIIPSGLVRGPHFWNSIFAGPQFKCDHLSRTEFIDAVCVTTHPSNKHVHAVKILTAS